MSRHNRERRAAGAAKAQAHADLPKEFRQARDAAVAADRAKEYKAAYPTAPKYRTHVSAGRR